MTSTRHTRNITKHEYEIQRGSSHLGAHIFVGNVEKTAVAAATALLQTNPDQDHFRLYHTYPSPGPLRRYVGVIKADGLHRARS
jgi:hypothetical protein